MVVILLYVLLPHWLLLNHKLQIKEKEKQILLVQNYHAFNVNSNDIKIKTEQWTVFSAQNKMKLVSYGWPKSNNLASSPEWGGLVHFSEHRLSTKKQADQSKSTKWDQRSHHTTSNKKKKHIPPNHHNKIQDDSRKWHLITCTHN